MGFRFEFIMKNTYFNIWQQQFIEVSNRWPNYATLERNVRAQIHKFGCRNWCQKSQNGRHTLPNIAKLFSKSTKNHEKYGVRAGGVAMQDSPSLFSRQAGSVLAPFRGRGGHWQDERRLLVQERRPKATPKSERKKVSKIHTERSSKRCQNGYKNRRFYNLDSKRRKSPKLLYLQ